MKFIEVTLADGGYQKLINMEEIQYIKELPEFQRCVVRLRTGESVIVRAVYENLRDAITLKESGR